MDGTVKVGDFGLVTASHHVETNTENITVGRESSNCCLMNRTPDILVESLVILRFYVILGSKGATDVHHTGQVGTQLYMSPEQVTRKRLCYPIFLIKYKVMVWLVKMLYCIINYHRLQRIRDVW